MKDIEFATENGSDKTMLILQSLLCVLREKNLLTRADIENLCEKVASAADETQNPLPCCSASALAAANEMGKIGDYIGRRYGGKHRRN
jgi:hypothetical protein